MGWGGDMQIAASDSRGLWEGDEEVFSTLWDTEKGDEGMSSGAESTGVHSSAWAILITADVFEGALKGQLHISDTKIQYRKGRKESQAGFK